MKKQNFDSIFKELTSLMPELKKNADEWKPFIQEFIESRPDSTLDENFKKELHQEILRRAEAMSSKDPGLYAERLNSSPGSKTITFWIRYIGTFLGGAAFAGFIIIPLGWHSDLLNTPVQSPQKDGYETEYNRVSDTKIASPKMNRGLKAPAEEFTSESSKKDDWSLNESVDSEAIQNKKTLQTENNMVNISEVAENSWSFQKSKTENQSEMPVGNETMELAVHDTAVMGRGGGGMREPAMTSMPMMPPYQGRINYEYMFDGDLPNIPDSIAVYRSDKKSTVQTPSMEIPALALETFDMDSFTNLGLQNLTLVEDADFGYRISIDLQRQHINMNQNWERWEPLMERCAGGARCMDKPLTKDDIPADRELIGIADEFLSSHKITVDSFGKPTIEKYWEEQSFSEEFYPSVMTVVYPFIIEDQIVVQNGNTMPFGMRVSIDVRLKKVTSVDIPFINLEKSSYEPLKSENLEKNIKMGGYEGVQYSSPQETKQVSLENPKIQLVQYMLWDNETINPQEIYIPSLVFEVVKEEEDTLQRGPYNYMPNQIVVPLAKDIFAQ